MLLERVCTHICTHTRMHTHTYAKTRLPKPMLHDWELLLCYQKNRRVGKHGQHFATAKVSTTMKFQQSGASPKSGASPRADVHPPRMAPEVRSTTTRFLPLLSPNALGLTLPYFLRPTCRHAMRSAVINHKCCESVRVQCAVLSSTTNSCVSAMRSAAISNG